MDLIFQIELKEFNISNISKRGKRELVPQKRTKLIMNKKFLQRNKENYK
jgi:hypothetical protein